MFSTQVEVPLYGKVSPSNGNLTCTKSMYLSQSGEIWDHAGGHFYTSVEGSRILNEGHVDAEALLSGNPVAHHKPEDCTKTGFCAWRK